MGRITVFLLAITVYAFGAMITSVKAGELDAFRIQSGNKNQTVTLAQVKKVLTGKKGCLYKRGYVKFKSNDMTKDLCNQAKGLGVVNEIHWKNLTVNAKKAILGL